MPTYQGSESVSRVPSAQPRNGVQGRHTQEALMSHVKTTEAASESWSGGQGQGGPGVTAAGAARRCVCARERACVCVCASMCVRVCIHVCAREHVYACVHTRVCAHERVCACVNTRV